MSFYRYSVWVALIFLVGVSSFVVAQEDIANLEKKISLYTTQFNDLEKLVTRPWVEEQELIDIQNKITSLDAEVRTYRQALAPRITDLSSQLEKLGTAPKEDAPPEPETVTQQRNNLSQQLGLLNASEKKAALLQTQMAQLQRQIQTLRLQLFTEEIFRRHTSPLTAELWQRVYIDAGFGYQNLLRRLQSIDTESISTAQIISFAIFFAIIAMILFGFSNYFISKVRSIPETENALPFLRKATAAMLVTLLRLIPPVVLATLLYVTVIQANLVDNGLRNLALTLLFACVIFFTVSALTRTLLSPKRPEWRLYPLPDGAAIGLKRLIQATAFVYALNLFLSELFDVINAPLSLSVGKSFIAACAFAILLIAIALPRLQTISGDAGPSSRLWPLWLKIPLWAIAIAVLICATAGYIALANFVASQVVVSGAILAMALLVYTAINEFANDLTDQQSSVGAWFAQNSILDEQRRKQFAFFVGFFLNFLLLVAVVPLLLFEWGFSWSDIQNWLNIIIFGVQIGSVNVSLATFFIALAIFVAGLVFTRFAQRWLDRGFLTVSNLQNGVGNSIKTGFGYVGFIISMLLAISYVGVDFTNLAIVAGALSVGIGFGLQSIVNNFVSGLILLVERPIKVGDWVVVGDQQGLVRRISVRSTEVETFDRSSVIIPNSEFITNQVINWTHGSTIGRVIVSVGVSYGSDAKEVYDILMDIGLNHPKALSFPKPLVVFEDFGASSLDFTLRVYISDIRSSLSVKTDLRMSILEAFRERDIEIPFPQRDLNIRTPEVLKVETSS